MNPPPDGKTRRPLPIAEVGKEPTAAAPGRSSRIARIRASALVRSVGGRPGVLVELALLLLWFLLFMRLDAAVGKDFAAANANALALQSMEHAVHIDIERSANVLDVAGSITLLAVSIAAASMWGRLAARLRHARSWQSSK